MFSWHGTWKDSYALTRGSGLVSLPHQAKTRKINRNQKVNASQQGSDGPSIDEAVSRSVAKPFFKVSGFYSDLLYQPHLCATIEMPREWLQVDNIDRRSGLSVEDFVLQYERPNRPVIITDAISK